MIVTGLEHLLIAVPEGGEDEERRFFIEFLGFKDVEKPDSVADRRGFWLTAGAVNLHIGTEADFRPAKKAHPAFLVADLDAVRTRLEAAGYPTTDDVALPGFRRFFTADPFGNRIELLEPDA